MSIISMPKHPLKIHVRAGISDDGGTCLAIFDGKMRMDSKFYRKTLKKSYVLSRENWTAQHGTPSYLQHGNDPKDESRYTTCWLKLHGVGVVWWPAESPGLNPVECLWQLFKEFSRSNVKPINKSELIAGVRLFWKERVTLELQKVLRAHTQRRASCCRECRLTDYEVTTWAVDAVFFACAAIAIIDPQAGVLK